MPFIPVPGVIQAELVYTWDSQFVETVLHFEPDGLATPTEMAELGAFLVTWYNTNMKAQMPSTLALVNVKLTDLTVDTGAVVNYATGLPLAGTNVSVSLPNNVAVTITKRTAFRGRSYRGRIYHPGLMESQVTNNTVAGGTLNGLIAIYDDLLSFSTAGEAWTLVVVSRQQNNEPREVGVATAVISLDSDGVIDSQRRRLPRRGG